MEAAQPAIISRLGARDEHIRRITEKLTRELGPDVCALLRDDTVIEIMLNPDGSLWVEQLGHPMQQFGRMSGSQAESLMATVASTLHTDNGAKSNPRMRTATGRLALRGADPAGRFWSHLHDPQEGATGLYAR